MRNRPIVLALTCAALVAAPAARAQSDDGSTTIELPRLAAQQIVREPAAKIDKDLLATVADATRTDQLVREPAAYVHLLAQARTLVPGDIEALGVKRLDVAAVRAAPAANRGVAFEVKGTLESIEPPRSGEPTEIRGTILDLSGERVAFTVLRESEANVGDIVRVRGFFFKLLAIETKPGEYADGIPCLVGKDLTRSFLPMPKVTALDPAVLVQVHESTRSEMMDLQPDVLFHVLAWARDLPAAERANLQGAQMDVRELDRDPDRWRGKLITFNARYLQGPNYNWTERLGPDGENPLEVDAFHEGILLHAANRKMRWISTEPLPPEAVGDHGITMVTGVFVKMLAWETTNGVVIGGPLIVPIRFDRFTLGDGSSIGRIGPWLAGAGAAALALLLWFMLRDRRETHSFRRDIAARLAAAGRTPAPPTDASS